MAGLERKTVKGSGGYIIADLTGEEVRKARLAGADLFIGALGRVGEDRIINYYCKNCSKQYDGAPEIAYEKVDQEVAEGTVLAEQGEYVCKQCGSLIASYKKFSEKQKPESMEHLEYVKDGFVPVRKLADMSVYDSDARLIGTVKEIGIREKTRIVMVVSTREQAESEVVWDDILSIGDVVMLRAQPKEKQIAKCNKCGFENKHESKFCEQCGNKLG